MPVPVKIPKLGMTMTEGTIVRWLVAQGDPIEKDQIIVEIETEKLVNEVAAPVKGRLARIVLEEGVTAQVAETMAWILLEGESDSDIPRSD